MVVPIWLPQTYSSYKLNILVELVKVVDLGSKLQVKAVILFLSGSPISRWSLLRLSIYIYIYIGKCIVYIDNWKKH